MQVPHDYNLSAVESSQIIDTHPEAEYNKNPLNMINALNLPPNKVMDENR